MVLGTYVLKDGRIEPAGGLDRGGPIVLCTEEWRARYRGIRRRTRLLRIIFAIAVIITIDVMLFFIEAPGELLPWFLASRLGLPLFILLLGILTVKAGDLIADLMPRDAPFRGLYERGIQVNRALFLPYDELKEVVVEGGFARLVPRKALPKGPWLVPNPQQWAVETELLGEEGLAELLARVSGNREAPVPPRLVVYGPPSLP